MSDVVVTKNEDGTIKIAGGEITGDFVPKSDLINVKTASEAAKVEHEKVVADHLTNLAEATRVKDETHQSLLQAQARIEQLEKEAEELPTLKTKVGELETSIKAADDSRRSTEDQLLVLKRESLVTKYKADPEKVKDMDLNQLTEAEKAMGLVSFNPANPQSANYDGGGGGTTGSGVPLTPVQQAAEELKLAREQAARKRRGESGDLDLKQ